MEESERLALSTLYLLGTDFTQVIRAVRKHDIGNWEIFDDGQHQLDKHRVEQLVKVARTRNVSFTVHGPICDLNVGTLNLKLRPRILERMRESLRNASLLGAESWVLHPGTHGALSWVKKRDDWKLNMSSLKALEANGKRLGIAVTIENISSSFAILGRARDFLRLYREWKSAPDMTLDVGHSHIKHETGTFLKNLREKVRNVHVSDNMGDVDTHLAVGSGTLDWKPTIRSLIGHGFVGKIIIESVTGPYASISKLSKFLRSLD